VPSGTEGDLAGAESSPGGSMNFKGEKMWFISDLRFIRNGLYPTDIGIGGTQRMGRAQLQNNDPGG